MGGSWVEDREAFVGLGRVGETTEERWKQPESGWAATRKVRIQKAMLAEKS